MINMDIKRVICLRSVVAAIKKLLRESDMLFRMGGDEFMVYALIQTNVVQIFVQNECKMQ